VLPPPPPLATALARLERSPEIVDDSSDPHWKRQLGTRTSAALRGFGIGFDDRKADTFRAVELAEAEVEAQAPTERMAIPTAMLLFGLLPAALDGHGGVIDREHETGCPVVNERVVVPLFGRGEAEADRSGRVEPPHLRAPAVIAETFADLAGAEAIVLFGSWAARQLGQPGRAPNDNDVLVIGEVDLDAMHDAADAAERQIGLPVQATARARDASLDADESFIREVRSRPLVPALVDDQASTLAADLEHLKHHQESTP
jgi:hypothetical protein